MVDVNLISCRPLPSNGPGICQTTILFHREHIDQALIHWILGGYHGGVLFQEQRALQVSLAPCLTWLKWQSGTIEDPEVYPPSFLASLGFTSICTWFQFNFCLKIRTDIGDISPEPNLLTIHKSKGHFGTDQIRHQDHIDVCILVGDRVKDKTAAKMINDIPLD